MWIVSISMGYLQCMVVGDNMRDIQELWWHKKFEDDRNVCSGK
ncbi:hypothetical protein C5S31_12215 [ANME-1 cluster archaeon GoMg2]|nr:hypothetical protein [ANME-1 cluster archaeon GoMg2]